MKNPSNRDLVLALVVVVLLVGGVMPVTACDASAGWEFTTTTGDTPVGNCELAMTA